MATEHKSILADGQHIIHRWRVKDQGELDDLAPESTEIDKIALKIDDKTYYRLVDNNPIEWKRISLTDAEITKIEDTYTKSEVDNIDDTKVDKVSGKELSDNNLTDDLLTLLTTNKVKNVTTDTTNNKLVITFTDDTTTNLNINDIVTDVNVTGATLDATTNVLTLTSDDGGADVTVDLSDFVNSEELTNALSSKANLSGATFTNDITAPTIKITNDTSDTTEHRVAVYDSGATSYGMMLWNDNVTDGNWSTMIYTANQTDRKVSFGRVDSSTFEKHSDVVEMGYFDANTDTFHVSNGDVVLEKISAGVVLKSPNGTSYRLTVNDDGSLQTTGV